MNIDIIVMFFAGFAGCVFVYAIRRCFPRGK